MGPRVNVTEVLQRLEKAFRPAYQKATDIAVNMGADYLREKISIQYSDPDPKTGKRNQSSLSSRALKGKRPKVIKWGKAKAYPKRRTGSLKASVSVTKAVFRRNVYMASFGILKNVLLGREKKKAKRYRTLYAAHKEKTANYLSHGGRIPGAGPKEPAKPTLYAKYLAEGTGKMSPRKLAREAWLAIKYSGELRAKIREELQGVGSRIVPGGRLPSAKFKTN